MLEIPERIWKKIAGYGKPQQVFRTNNDNVLCWKAIRRADKIPVVIKLFEWAVIEEARAEVTAAEQIKKISHPHLIRILDIGEDDDIGIYYVMEYWGKDLRDTIQLKVDDKVVLGIIRQVLEGLSELHRHKMPHRDIKPENTYYKSDIVKLGDYGLVKSQRFIRTLSTIAGTRGYMAPEVFSGKYDKRCDIYSVGVVLRELLTAEQPPFKSDKPANIPDDSWAVITKAMAQSPDKRFQDAEDFIRALNDLMIITVSIKRKPKKKPQDKKLPKHLADMQKYKPTSGGQPVELKKGEWWKPPPKDKPLPQTPPQRQKDLIPIFQEIKSSRYPPKPHSDDDPGILIKTLQAGLDKASSQVRDISNPQLKEKKMLEIAQELATAIEKRFTKQNSRTADIYDKVAEIYLKLDDYQNAEKYYRESMAIDKQLYGEPTKEVLADYYRLAEVFRKAGNYEKARETYLFMIASSERIWKGRPEEAIIRNNLAGICYLLKDYQTPIGLLQEALSINERITGKLSDEVIVNLINLYLTYQGQDNVQTANTLKEKATEIIKSRKGPNNKLTSIPYYLETMFNEIISLKPDK